MIGNIIREDIRFVLWTGSKFLFFGRKEFIDKRSSYVNLDGEIVNMPSVSDWVAFIPLNFSMNMGIDGTGSMSMTFEAPEGKFDFRYKGSRGSLVDPGNIFRVKMLDTYIKPYRDSYYKHFVTFDDEYFRQMDQYLEPTYIFSLPQIIWVDLMYNDVWYRVFTGIVNSTTETENVGRNKTIVIRANNFLQLTTKVPLIQQYQIAPMTEAVLPRGKEFMSFWKVYMMSVMVSKETQRLGFDPTADMSLDDIFKMFVTRLNFSLGCVTEEDKDKLKKLIEDNEGLRNTMKVEAEDVEVYYESVKRDRYYDFKLFNEQAEIDTYEGEENSVGELVGFKDLFQFNDIVSKKASAIGRLKFSNTIKQLLNKDKQKEAINLPGVFKKLFTITMRSLFNPSYVMMSNLIRRISTGYGFYSHADPFGNWIVEYPNFNALPKINSGDALEELAFKDNDDRYILNLWTCSSMSHSVDPSKYITYIELPMQFHGPYNITTETVMYKFVGRSWSNIKEFLQFGLNSMSLDNLYFSFGDLTMNAQDFLALLTSMIRHRLNSEVFSASVRKVLSAYMQVGRIVIIPHKEKKYLLSQLTHSYDSGTGGSTTLVLTHGRPLTDIIENPWDFFLEYVKDIYEATEDSDKSVDTGSGIIVGNVEDVEKAVGDCLNIKDFKFINPELQPAVADKLSVYVPLPPGPTRVETSKSLQQLACKNVKLPDPRLLRTIDIILDKLKRWASNEFKDVYAGAQLQISSIWREATPSGTGQNTVSRHCEGRAVDISGVVIFTKGLRGNIPITYNFNYNKGVNTYERKIPDLIVGWLVDLGYKKNVPEEPGKDVCFWHYHATAGSGTPKQSDYNHDRHIHFSVSRQ